MHVVTAEGRPREVPSAKAAGFTPDATAAAVRVWEFLADLALYGPSPFVDGHAARQATGHLGEVLDRDLLPDLSQSRALARQGVAVGDAAMVDRAQLSESERGWLLGHLAWRRGRRNEAAEHFSALPLDCYPDVTPLLVCHAPRLPRFRNGVAVRLSAHERLVHHRGQPRSYWYSMPTTTRRRQMWTLRFRRANNLRASMTSAG